jgi:penicillin-binding protein 1A
VLTKQQILELYLNEIPLGRQSFGVQAAARAYFDKDVDELDLSQAAFLAILPKAPEVYGRASHAAQALARRNWVLDQMVKNGWASPQAAAEAKAKPLGLIQRRVDSYDPSIGYFVEEVRRQLIAKYGENAEDGPDSVYAGGLWVRTSLDPEVQKAAQNALRAGLLRYAAGRGWHGPIEHIKLDPDKWQTQLISANKSITYQNWRVGLVLARSGSAGTIGFSDGSKAPLGGLSDGVRPGDIIAAAPSGGGYVMRVIPEVSGGMLVENPHNGRVLAMQGGFDSGLGSFNRATQAERQPGSTIKPFVYATALDYGMTPASQVVDGPFCVYQGAALGQKCFRNFDMRGAGGTHTMRWGLEQSRNLMTIRIANNAGMDNVVKTARTLGIGDYQPNLAIALGAGETTLMKLAAAYAVLDNGGHKVQPTLIDRIQDRWGHTIYRHDERPCADCNADWANQPPPELPDTREQVENPQTAYQMTSMLEGVIQRGTGQIIKSVPVPLAGKTGTSSEERDAWFMGYSPNLVVGVFVGYHNPTPLGRADTGGRTAAPIFRDIMMQEVGNQPAIPFRIPPGINLVKIDLKTGQPASSEDPNVILEAFKEGTEPQTASTGPTVGVVTGTPVTGLDNPSGAPQPGAGAAINSGTGGLY